MCFLWFLNCFWAARSCSDVWLSFRSFGGTGTTDDNPWKQPRWNKQCGLEWFDYLIACASTNKRGSLRQKRLHNSIQFLFALFVKHDWVDTKVVLGFIGICRDLVCWTIVFVCFHGLVCFGGVFVANRNTDNTGWQHKKATTVWCQCEDRWIERLTFCCWFCFDWLVSSVFELIDPLSLHVLPKLGKTWLVLLVDVFSLFFELFLSCSKLQWCAVQFKEKWWDRHHWWQPMKATTLKQPVWTWMVRLPDSLCKHQQERQPPTEEIAQFHTIPVCALCEARTEWIQSGIGIHRHMQRSCLLDHSVCVFPWPCVLGVVSVADRNTDNRGWQHKKATTVWCQCEDRWID